MEEDDDFDFEVVELGLITYGGDHYDIFDLYRKKDKDGNDYVFGRYFMKKWHIIIGRANIEDHLSQNLSTLAVFSKERGLNKPRGISEKILKKNFYLN